MTGLPEDVTSALAERPGVVRQHALEQALMYALAASAALGSDGSAHVARVHVSCMAEVSRAWSALAAALPGGTAK